MDRKHSHQPEKDRHNEESKELHKANVRKSEKERHSHDRHQNSVRHKSSHDQALSCSHIENHKKKTHRESNERHKRRHEHSHGSKEHQEEKQEDYQSRKQPIIKEERESSKDNDRLIDVEYQSDKEKTMTNTSRGLKRKDGIDLNTDDGGSDGGGEEEWGNNDGGAFLSDMASYDTALIQKRKRKKTGHHDKESIGNDKSKVEDAREKDGRRKDKKCRERHKSSRREHNHTKHRNTSKERRNKETADEETELTVPKPKEV